VLVDFLDLDLVLVDFLDLVLVDFLDLVILVKGWRFSYSGKLHPLLATSQSESRWVGVEGASCSHSLAYYFCPLLSRFYLKRPQLV